MSKIKEYREFLSSVRSSLGYWKSYSLLQFTLSVTRMMRTDKVSGKELASRLGISATQVSKVLRGSENVTIETMAKFADALGAAVHIHVAKKGVRVEWREVSSGTEKTTVPDYEGLIRAPDSDDLDQWEWDWPGSPEGLRSRRG
jgi:transcriptional regulator with XRE-family HTH domain